MSFCFFTQRKDIGSGPERGIIWEIIRQKDFLEEILFIQNLEMFNWWTFNANLLNKPNIKRVLKSSLFFTRGQQQIEPSAKWSRLLTQKREKNRSSADHKRNRDKISKFLFFHFDFKARTRVDRRYLIVAWIVSRPLEYFSSNDSFLE